MTKEDVYKACKEYADEFTKKNVVMPKNQTIVDTWDKADFLRFRTQASKTVSQIDLNLKSIASKVSDKIYEELITSVGGERA